MAGGNPSLSVKITADIAALKAALELGQTELIKTAAGAKALSGSMSGAKLEQSAYQMAVAIKALGGASVLTADEAKKADKAFQDWFTKSAKTGAEVKPALKDIAAQVHAVAQASDEAKTHGDGFFASLAGGVATGTLLGNALTKMGELGIEALKKLGETIVDLALQGSKELGIEKAFNRLTGQVGQNAKVVLEDLKKATHGTVEEMDLMIRVNENLAAGMNLSEKQYKTLAAGAFALAKATGKDVKDAFDTMSDAMLTGRTRAVALLTGKIDLAQAETNYAKQLGVTRDELSSEGKIEAARVAIVEKVGGAIERLGEQTDGLGTKVKQAQVWWKDFQDEIGKAMAGSPVLISIVNEIGNVLSKTFGVAREEAVKRLAQAVDELAIQLIGVAAAVAPVIGVIGGMWNQLQIWFRENMQTIDLQIVQLKMLELAAIQAIDAIKPGGFKIELQQQLRTEIKALTITLAERQQALGEDRKEQTEWMATGERLGAALKEMQTKAEASRRTFQEHKDAVEENGEVLDQNTDRFINTGAAAEEAAKKLKSLTDTGTSLATGFQTMFNRGASAEEMFKAFGSKAAGLQVAFDELGVKVPEQFAWIVQTFKDMGKQIEQDKTIEAAMKALTDANRKALDEMVKDTETLAGKQRDALNKAFTGNLDVQIKAQTDLEKYEGDSLDKRIAVVRRDMESRRALVKQGVSTTAGAMAEIDTLETAAAAEATRAWQEHLQDVEQSTKGYGDIFANALSGIPDIIAQALTGGGGIGNAIGAIFTKLTGDIGSKLFSGSSGLGQSLAQGAVNLFGGNIGGKIAGALPAIGQAFGGITAAMTQSTNKAVSVLGQAGSWAMQGAAIGSIIPGIGTAIGAGVGAVAGAIKGLLNNSGKKTNDLRDEYVKAQGGFEALAKKAREAGVELNSQSAFQTAKTEADFKKAVEALEAKMKTFAAERAEMLRAVMAGEKLATQKTLDEMAAAAKGSGDAAKEAAAYFDATLKTAASGLTRMFAGLEKGATSAAQAAAVKLHMAAGMTEEAAKKAASSITGIFVKTQAQATGLAGAIAGTFGKMIENGSSFRDALAAIKGPLDTMRKQLEATGLSGGDAFNNLSRMGQIAGGEITGPLMDAIDGANQALIGLSNSGLMNQDTFAALATTATDAYTQIIAQGVDGQAAMQMMQPTLQTMWEMQQQFGYETDAATQALIDEAVAAGTVGEAHMSAAERTAKSMERVATVMEAIAKKMGVDLPAAAEAGASRIGSAFDKIDPKIPAPWDGWGPPPDIEIDYRFNQTGDAPPGMASGGVVYAAGGWMQPKGSDIVPAMLTPGERVLTVGQNYDYENRMRSGSGSGSAAPAPINITIQALDPIGLKQVVEKDVVPLLVSAYRRNVNGARTDTRKELVE